MSAPPRDAGVAGTPGTSDAAPRAEQRWLVYATFDPDGEPAGHAVAQIAAHRQLGFEAVVVDTSPVIGGQRAADWQRIASCWFQRPNVGYDFTSYRDGVRHLLSRRQVGVERLHLILANDSCYGPFGPLAPLLAVAATEARTVVGVTESWEEHHHLQSYWLSFRPGTAADAVDFLEQLPALGSRWDAIAHGELALAKFLVARGCRPRAACPTRELMARFAGQRAAAWPTLAEFALRRFAGRPKYNRAADTVCLKHLLRRADPFAYFNPTFGFGVAMHRAGMIPFVKRALVHTNPYDDRAIPAGLPARLSNEEVARILAG